MNPALALPGDTFVAWLILATAAFIALVCWARDADHRLQQIIDGLLELEAADHDEPSRAQVEAEWTDETPIYSATAAHVAKYAAAELDDEWAAMQREIGEAS